MFLSVFKFFRIHLSAMALIAFLASLGFSGSGCDPTPSQTAVKNSDDGSASKLDYAAYGGSVSCQECHAEAYTNWARSHHALAERLPESRQEDAAFSPTRTFKHGSQQTTFRSTNGHYELITAGLRGTNEAFCVERVLGENPLRQMLVPIPGGRLQVSEAAWDPRSNEWFNVYGNEDRKPGEWGHWLGRGMNWNSMCAICHNTRLQKGYDATQDTYHTVRAEQGVGCEACHGPMKAHNDWQHANRGKGLTDPTIKKFSREQMFDTCAACHSRRGEITSDVSPGASYWDHFILSIVDDSELFYADGQIRDEDYEFTAFLGSGMHKSGVRCVDCHDVHTMKTRLPGNQLCQSCHAQGSKTAPAIDPVQHSHHKVFGYDTNTISDDGFFTEYKPGKIKETGGECVNCHMPQTVYMERHWRHDHGFTIPDPLLTKQFGIPNACERCHADKGTDWNLKYVEQWYGKKMDRPYRQRAQIIARAKRGDESARAPLVGMLTTNDNSYWQAVAAGLLHRWVDDPTVAAALTSQLNHTNPLVRQMAVQSLGVLAQSGQPEIIAALQPKLADPSRNVRVEAARHLGATLDTNSPAGKDYLRFLAHNSDQPLGQLQIGMLQLMRGNPTNALLHYEKAVAWDPYSPGIRNELAVLLSQLGRFQEAVAQLEEAVRLAPNEAQFHYTLALALNETGDTTRVATELEQAVKCDPQFSRAWYNLGLIRSQSADHIGALEALTKAESADPNDPRSPFAAATILAKTGKISEAREACRRALKLAPEFTDAANLLRQLEDR